MEPTSIGGQHHPGLDSLPAGGESAGRHVHIDPRKLERFLRGEASVTEALAVVRHLLAGCPSCVAVTRPVWGFAEHRLKARPRNRRKKKRSRAGALEVLR